MVLKSVFVILGFTIAILVSLRLFDWISDKRERTRLLAFQPLNPSLFDPQTLEGLPEAAKRFFRFAIKPGTPLLTVAEIEMGGEFSLGNLHNPSYQKMSASQVLSLPEGFVWELSLPGPVSISGSDSGQWTRFRLLGLIPVARLGGTEDHRRSAFGRYVAESLFWTPAALLPNENIEWQGVTETLAKVRVRHQGLEQEVELEIDPNGKPLRVFFSRWSDANSEKVYRLQPFGGTFGDFREVQGFMIPFKVEAGNHYGTPDYFPFFKAQLKSVRYPQPQN